MVEMGGRRVEEVALIHSAERTILRVRPLDKRPRQTLHRREWRFNGCAGFSTAQHFHSSESMAACGCDVTLALTEHGDTYAHTHTAPPQSMPHPASWGGSRKVGGAQARAQGLGPRRL